MKMKPLCLQQAEGLRVVRYDRNDFLNCLAFLTVFIIFHDISCLNFYLIYSNVIPNRQFDHPGFSTSGIANSSAAGCYYAAQYRTGND